MVWVDELGSRTELSRVERIRVTKRKARLSLLLRWTYTRMTTLNSMPVIFSGRASFQT